MEDKSNGNICGHFLIRDMKNIDTKKDMLYEKHECLRNVGMYVYEVEKKVREKNPELFGSNKKKAKINGMTIFKE